MNPFAILGTTVFMHVMFNLVIAGVCIWLTLSAKYKTNSFEILALWLMFIAAIVNIEDAGHVAGQTSPSQMLMNGSVALMMVLKVVRMIHRKKFNRTINKGVKT